MVGYVLIISMVLGVVCPSVVAAVPLCSKFPGDAYLARHAKKVGSDGEGLKGPEGWFQAGALMGYFRGRGITHIYTTEIRRARETVRPLAVHLSIEPKEVNRGNPSAQVRELCDHDPKDHVVVVGHSNTLPKILEEMGIRSPTIYSIGIIFLFSKST